MSTTRGQVEWKRKQRLMAAGLCRDCGRPRDHGGDGQRCKKHRLVWNGYQKLRQRRIDESAT